MVLTMALAGALELFLATEGTFDPSTKTARLLVCTHQKWRDSPGEVRAVVGLLDVVASVTREEEFRSMITRAAFGSAPPIDSPFSSAFSCSSCCASSLGLWTWLGRACVNCDPTLRECS